jgi:hypothetical protein
MKKVALLIVIAVIFTACQTDKTTSNPVNEDSTEVLIDTIESDSVVDESIIPISLIIE